MLNSDLTRSLGDKHRPHELVKRWGSGSEVETLPKDVMPRPREF